MIFARSSSRGPTSFFPFLLFLLQGGAEREGTGLWQKGKSNFKQIAKDKQPSQINLVSIFCRALSDTKQTSSANVWSFNFLWSYQAPTGLWPRPREVINWPLTLSHQVNRKLAHFSKGEWPKKRREFLLHKAVCKCKAWLFGRNLIVQRERERGLLRHKSLGHDK